MYQKSYQETEESRHNRLVFNEKLIYIISVPLIAFLMTVFIFHFYRIDGPSMEDTLRQNDRVIIEKLGKTWAGIKGEQYVPKRYDVVVFTRAGEVSEEDVIKRVVALPGERIVVLNNDVRVYNANHPEGILVDHMAPAEALIDDVTAGYIDLVLKPGEIFVLGDNRDASYDSRNFGPIQADSIIGTLTTRLYPFQDISFY